MKKRLVKSKSKQNDYNLKTGENGVYFLDYPTQSMTQGFVIFPKKGETMQAGVLKSAIDTLLIQVTNDNKKIDSTLTKYFRSEIGVNNTRLAKAYDNNVFPLVDKVIPSSIACSLLNQNTSFLINGAIVAEQDSIQQITKHGILLNELEYEQIRSFYTNVYKQIMSNHKFNKQKGLNHYLDIVSESTPIIKKIKRRKLKKMSMRELTKITTGFSLPENKWMDKTIKELIKDKELKPETVLQYFEQYREIAAKLGSDKGDNIIRIEHQGQVFYWLNEEYVPIIKQK